MRSSDRIRPNSLYGDTFSTGIPEIWMVSKLDKLYFKEDISISLHFFGLSFIPRSVAKLFTSSTTTGSNLENNGGQFQEQKCRLRTLSFPASYLRAN